MHRILFDTVAPLRIRDPDALESAAAIPQATFGSDFDGNKRDGANSAVSSCQVAVASGTIGKATVDTQIKPSGGLAGDEAAANDLREPALRRKSGPHHR
jgi:hypothetical protein